MIKYKGIICLCNFNALYHSMAYFYTKRKDLFSVACNVLQKELNEMQWRVFFYFILVITYVM